MAKERPRPPGKVRLFGDQLEELCRERGLRKSEVAERAGISPAQLSHYLKFGCSLTMIERISKAVSVFPYYFDVYVAENSSRLIAEHKELLEFFRTLHAGAGAKKLKALRKVIE